MACELEAPEQQQRHEIADVQALGRRVEADVERHRPALETLAQRVEIGVILNQPARQQVVDDGGGAHAAKCCKPAPPAAHGVASAATAVREAHRIPKEFP